MSFHGTYHREEGYGEPVAVPRLMTDHELGILPVTPSKLYTRAPYTRGRGRAGRGWKLPGNGAKRESCGTFKKLDGCLNYLGHENCKVLIKREHWHCNSLACPVCAGHAMTRASDRIVHRLVSWWRDHPRWNGHHLKPIHVVISPSPDVWARYSKNYKRLRDLATQIALESGLFGGAVIPHPYRHVEYGDDLPGGQTPEGLDLSRGWYESWHFHIIGFGWIGDSSPEGWIVKNLGTRGNSPKDHRIFELSRYQLSHCGVNDQYHTVTWIGDLSSRKYKAPLMRSPLDKCPECGQFLLPVICDVKTELAPKEGVYWVDPPGWRYVNDVRDYARVCKNCTHSH